MTRSSLDELIVVAAFGNDWWPQCSQSLPGQNLVTVDTTRGGHPTGAYIRAWQSFSVTGTDRFLFIQDSMTAAVPDPLAWFRDQWPGSGAVAWQRFPMQWDSAEQRRKVEGRYTARPAYGIFGPVFYTDRASLNRLAEAHLLPDIPANRLDAQGTERAWAYAFDQAGMPVVGPVWQPNDLLAGKAVGPFSKVFARRP